MYLRFLSSGSKSRALDDLGWETIAVLADFGIDTLTTNEPGHVLEWVMQPISYARHRLVVSIAGRQMYMWPAVDRALSYVDAPGWQGVL
jgi:hypothetical protein